MKKFVPPIMHSAVIMGDDPFLIAELSAILAQKGKYLPVIDCPRVLRDDLEGEVVRRNNAMARSAAVKVVMAGVADEVSALFSGRIPAKMTFKVDALDENTHKKLGLPGRTGQALIWGKANIGIGLLRALQSKVPIEFTDAPSTDRFVVPQGDHLVVCEDNNEHSQVIAANYAYAIGAGLFLIDTVGKKEAEALCEDFYVASENRHESMSSLLERLRVRLKELAGDIPMSGVRGMTFISDEIPWGFAFRDVPTTHLFKYPDLGISIINGVAAEQPNAPGIRTAAVIDPATIASTEVKKMAELLAERRILVRRFFGANATVNEISNMLELFPYDLLLIATHCGDSSGWRETYRFTDNDGIAREFVMDTAVALSYAPGRKKHQVTAYERPVSLNGVDWNNKTELKKIIGNSVKDFFGVPSNVHTPDERVKIDRVAGSAAMKMFDGNILIVPTALADNLTPVILNNACTSWHQLAARIMFGNARAYIGTLIPVIGAEAEEIAERVLKKHFGKPLAVALWHAQNEVYQAGIRRPYLLVGIHYQRLSSTSDNPRAYLLQRLSKSLSYWLRRLDEVPIEDENKRLSMVDYIEFLQREIAGLKEQPRLGWRTGQPLRLALRLTALQSPDPSRGACRQW